MVEVYRSRVKMYVRYDGWAVARRRLKLSALAESLLRRAETPCQSRACTMPLCIVGGALCHYVYLEEHYATMFS